MRHSAARLLLAPFLAVLLLLANAGSALGADYRAGDRVVVEAGETVSDDLYAAAGTTVIEGTVDGDLTVASGTVDVRGTVTGSVNASGGNVDVSGSVGGAVRSLGGSVTISGEVGRDVVVAGGNLVVRPDATVAGDVAGAAGNLEIGGTVEGDVLAGAGELVVTGRVGGTIDANLGHLRIGPDAVVGGDVLYASEREGQIDSGAEIGGTVERREPEWAGYRALLPDNALTAFLGALLGLLVLGWGLMLARPGWVINPGLALVARPLLAFGAGLATWVGQFLLLIVLAVLGAVAAQLASSFGGAFIVPFVIVLLAVIALIFISQAYVAMAIGGAIALRTAGFSPWLAYALGALVWSGLLALVGWLLPAIGALLFFVGWVLGLGGLVLDTLARRRTDPVALTPAGEPVPAA